LRVGGKRWVEQKQGFGCPHSKIFLVEAKIPSPFLGVRHKASSDFNGILFPWESRAMDKKIVEVPVLSPVPFRYGLGGGGL
jgi:hypothetical protein